ncbi:unnamed protein product [Brassica oleracea]
MLTRQTSMSQRAMSSTLTSAANLSNLLPTGHSSRFNSYLPFSLRTAFATMQRVCLPLLSCSSWPRLAS